MERTPLGMRIQAQIFGMDLRALALARIAIGLVLFVDFFHRLRFAELFLSETGIAPRRLFLESYGSLWLPAVQLANDTAGYQVAILLLQMVLALGLGLGYRTRICSVASWFLLCGLQARNPMVCNSGDSLLAALLLWGMFLPWGALWSLDARQPGYVAPQVSAVCSAATVGWGLQMVCLYLFAGLHKFHPYWLEEKSAVYYALTLGHHATGAAAYLTSYPGLLQLLSPAVVVFELALALCLLAPWPRFRTAVLLAAALMHLGFGLFLEIGIFRYSPIVGLLALLPCWRWREPQATARLQLQTPQTLPLLVVCLLMWAINLELLGKGKPLFLPSWLVKVAPAVVGYQHWGVFAGPSLESGGWFAVEVETTSGSRHDAWRSDRPFETTRPALISATYPDDRWRKTMLTLASLPPQSPYLERFAQWSLEQWDRRHPERPARSVRVWRVVETSRLQGGYSEPEWRLLVEQSR